MERRSVSLLVAFVDFTRFQVTALRKTNLDIADSLDGLYRLVEERIGAAEGRVVKFMGDAALITFEEDAADRGVNALLDLKNEIDEWLPANGWTQSHVIVKVHFGEVVAGGFGNDERYDIIGNTVNTAATLDTRVFALSPQAFRQLSPDTRQRFKKHTPPITYIRAEDRH